MVGAKIKLHMERIGMSQVHLSALAGISVAKMSLILSGRRRMSLDDYQTICWALGVGVDMFIAPKLPDRLYPGGLELLEGHGAAAGEWDDDDGIF
jgi:transcriptional regulator with XRE-family HTH domain